MIVQKREVEALLAKLEPPAPPHSLRDRVLHRAGPVLDLQIVRDRWTRIFVSRSLRAAWVVTLACLILANVFLPAAIRRPRRNWFLIEAAWRTPELRQALRIPRLHKAYVSLDAFAYRQSIGHETVPAESHRKEKI